jgi:flavin reductase (DIM6/NTAB) family NADH-FMN oxidoreductase RutF
VEVCDVARAGNGAAVTSGGTCGGRGAPFDRRTFDGLVAAGNTAMVVVAAADGDEADACLVGFHCQCSIDPVRYAVWLSKANRTFRLAERARALTVHWLAQEHRDLAAAAGSVSLDDDPAKMRRVRWHAGPEGAPVLDDAPGGMVGLVLHTHDDGDHVCFVLEPVAAWRHDLRDVLRFDDVRGLEPGHEADDRPAD